MNPCWLLLLLPLAFLAGCAFTVFVLAEGDVD